MKVVTPPEINSPHPRRIIKCYKGDIFRDFNSYHAQWQWSLVFTTVLPAVILYNFTESFLFIMGISTIIDLPL